MADAVLEVPLTRTALGVDEDTLTPLGKAVLRAVDHAPLDRVAEVCKARQDDGEVAPTLARRTLGEPVHVLVEAVLWMLELEEPVD